jgi:hypothetical protein
MKTTTIHNEKMARMKFSTVYPLYLNKITKKGRTKEELDKVIEWLTGFNNLEIEKLFEGNTSFEKFFDLAKINPKSHLIKGAICGYRIEELINPLTQKIRILDKLVDDLAKGRSLEKILF